MIFLPFFVWSRNVFFFTGSTRANLNFSAEIAFVTLLLKLEIKMSFLMNSPLRPLPLSRVSPRSVR